MSAILGQVAPQTEAGWAAQGATVHIASKIGLTRVGTYGLVQAVTTAVDYAIFIELVYGLGQQLLIANVTGWVLSLLVSYALHSVFTFRQEFSILRFTGFLIIALVTLALSTTVVLAVSTCAPPALAKIIAIGATFALGYWLMHSTLFPEHQVSSLPII
jgi:putative flippase GtrA